VTVDPEFKSGVVTVGKGRGFVMEGHGRRLIITAAHCLPRFPPRHAASHLKERTYRRLLASLQQKPTIWAECLFADPIADIALLGPPDGQELCDQCLEYDEWIENMVALPIAEPSEDRPVCGY
jgi:hypothetical protein